MSSCFLWWALEDCIGLLLHTTQSFVPFCFRKINTYFAPCYFGVTFASLTSAYAKSSRTSKEASRYQNTQNKRDDNKCHHLFYGGR